LPDTIQHTNGCELGTNVYDHDNRHDESQDVHKVVGGFEDERVGDFNRARIAPCRDAGASIDILVTNKCAERYRRLCAYRLEVTEAHVDGV
jgi:hypothetical protein